MRKHQHSLASAIKEELLPETPPLVPSTSRSRHGKQAQKTVDTILALVCKVIFKIDEGNFRGAVRLASSEDVLPEFSDATYTSGMFRGWKVLKLPLGLRSTIN